MASQSSKEKFFAHLDSLDESTESESDSEKDRTSVLQRTRKRQKLAKDINVKDDARPAHTAGQVRNPARGSADHSRQPKPASPNEVTVHTDHEMRPSSKQQLVSSHDTARVTHTKPKSGVREICKSYGLFKGFTFYFIPNDNVAKPRKLRIESAVAHGAVWTRTLGPGTTHIIVDPDITAAAVAKYVKSNTDTTGAVFVKMNWLIESLSHKSIRNPADSRFRLKGVNAVMDRSAGKSPFDTISRQVLVLDQSADNDELDSDIQPIQPENQLDEIVQMLKTTPELPIDEELDIDQFLSISSGGEQQDQSSRKQDKTNSVLQRRRSRPPEENKIDSAMDGKNAGFSCMQSNPGKQVSSPNDRTIAILQQMATYYDRTGDNWRTLAYRRAMTALRKHPTHVRTAKEACKIHGIGIRLADKIEEIVTTDRLKRLDAVLSDPDDDTLQLFMGIYGVGVRQAKAWMEKGYRTLEDLTEHAKLTTNQKIGIEHHADFSLRIPRSEVKQHGDIVAQSLKVANRDLQSIIGGSYRRGSADSGDIDIIITHPTAALEQLQTWVFDIIVPHLFTIDFMKCALATSRPSPSTPQRPSTLTSPSVSSKPNSTTNKNANRTSTNATTTASSRGSKFHGASQLPSFTRSTTNPWRRIDLLLVPPTSLGASLIYFTGNDIFNRSLRLLASKKGMRLNQYGLYRDVMRGQGRQKVTEGELVEGRSERAIFERLGVPWREARERNC